MNHISLITAILLLSISLSARSTTVYTISDALIHCTSITPDEDDNKNYSLLDNVSSSFIETIVYDTDNAIFTTTTHQEIAFIELSTEDNVVFKKLPIFSKQLHLNLSNYAEGEYQLKITYADHVVPGVITIQH